MTLEVAAKGMEGSRVDDECGCYVEAIEIRGESPTEEAKQCLQSCRDQFLETVSIDHETPEGWKYVCKDLTSATPSSRFWSLYWCDTTFCGVWINQTGGLQQDPNVDLIINSCQDIGFHSVLDPGPPPLDFVCQTGQGADGSCSQTGVKINPVSTPSPPVIQQPISIPSTFGSATTISSVEVAAPLSLTISPAATPTTTEDVTLITDPSGPPTTTSATPAQPTVAESVDVNNGTAPSKGAGLSMGVKAAISVCSVTGFIVMVALAFLCLQRRKKHRSGLDDVRGRSRSRLDNGLVPKGSPAPLISSSHDSRPLIPPLRLRDRKLLPSILRSGYNQSPSPPLTPLTPAHSHGAGGGGGHSSVMFPSSPITSPTTNKLVPRHERTPRVHGTSGSLPSLPPPALFGMHSSGAPGSRGSLSSFGAGSTTGPSSLRNEAFSVSGTTSPPPTSPTRPPRPHEGPLEIPDLVKPAPFPFGSRINRSGPAAPPHPVSPLSHTSSAAMAGSSVSPIWNQGRAISSSRDERDSGDHHHAIGEYPGQDRGSWGSWSDNGYGYSYGSGNGIGNDGNGSGNGSGRKVTSAIINNSGNAAGSLSPVRGTRSTSTGGMSPPPRLPLRLMAMSTMSSTVVSNEARGGGSFGQIGFAVTGGLGRSSNSAAVSTLHEEDGGLF